LLLVEGDTEKLAFPEFANKLDLDLDRAGATIIEVSGKRNLQDFAELATSLQIPTGIVYDKDSTDFRDKHDEEKLYNEMLDSFYDEEDDVNVWRLDTKYEDVIRATVGEQAYQTLCQRYPNVSNATRQRLIAADPEMPVPDVFARILKWLAAPKNDLSSLTSEGLPEIL
jgi:putative ATP-dependent endonuclease of the OLD family